MKKMFLGIAAFAVLAFPSVTLAHQHETYKVGNKQYELTIGSLNEPTFVDDKTGVDFRVAEIPTGSEHDHDSSATGTPVTGLEKTLKVEISAGDQKKVLDLSPAFGNPGAYTAPFYPTVATTYTYRVFGSMNDTEVNFVFTCNPAGHPATADDMNEVVVSNQVTRTMKSGAFGCPRPRTDAGFPEVVPSGAELSASVDSASGKASSSSMMGIAGIVLGLVGTVLGGLAFAKTRKVQ